MLQGILKLVRSSQEATVTEHDMVTPVNLDFVLPVIQCFYYATCVFPIVLGELPVCFWMRTGLPMDRGGSKWV